MSRIFITGATGNVGKEVIASLLLRIAEWEQISVVAAVTDTNKANHQIEGTSIKSVQFNFNHLSDSLLQGDRVFLLRPPALADVNKTFLPFIECAVKAKVAHIVFISVQGVEKSSFIPHHGIEKLIVASGIPFTFLRNSYFMQNLTTTLLEDICTKKELFVPAGKAVFNWVDVKDIGAVAAEILLNPINHKNMAYEVTGNENKNFYQVAELLSSILNEKIRYCRPSLLDFYLTKRKEGVVSAMILVMMFLHYIPNFIPAPKKSDTILKILKRAPGTLADFITRNKSLLRFDR